MTHYAFEALDRSGRTVRGRRAGDSVAQLRSELERQALTPITIRTSRLPALKPRASLDEASAGRFACDLARYLRSGLAVTQALALLEETGAPRAKTFIGQVRDRILSGEPLSSALERAGGGQSRVLPTLAAAGEASGRLADILDVGGKAMLASSALRRRLITLSLYPAFVLTVALAAVALYAFAVLPALEPALGDLTGSLPTSTRLVLVGGRLLRQVLPVLALAAAGGGLLLSVSSRARTVVWEAVGKGLMSPAAGSVMKDVIFSGLASRMAISLQAGVPLPVAFKTSAEAVSLGSVRARLIGLSDQLRDGEALSVALDTSRLAPADLVRLVQVGERSDDLGRMLDEAGQSLASRAQEKAERLLAAATPLIVILIGALVGAVTLLVFQGLMAVTDAVDI